MSNSTPEYVAAHLKDLADHPPKVSPRLKAEYRAARRMRRSAFVAGALRFGGNKSERSTEARRTRPNPAS